MTRKGPTVFVCRISESSEAATVEGGFTVWQMAAALTTMSIFPVARMMDSMAAPSVTDAACTVTSTRLGKSDSNSFLSAVRVESVRPMIIIRSTPACAKALQIPFPIPPAVFFFFV